LLDKGANPNIFGMGTTAFLLAAGVNPYAGRGGGGGDGGAPNTELLDLLIQHGADVNTQITGVLSYSMRISRQVSTSEGLSALHTAVQSANTDMVRYLLAHGARTDLKDRSGRTPLDVANGVPAQPLPPDAGGARIPDPYAQANVTDQQGNAPAAPAGTGGRGGRGGANPEALAEIRALLQEASQRGVR
jgi:hypothetical protein